MASVNTVNRIMQTAFFRRSIYSLKASSLLYSRGTTTVSPASSLLPYLKSQIHFYSSDSVSTGRIITHSTLIVQDGIDIEELPILIKRATAAHSSLSSHSHSYSGDKFMEESAFDTTFRQDLHNCYSVNDVFKLLEMPSEKVWGISASLALQRLHVLKYLNSDWNQIHSFIRSAVMQELYDTVQRDVGLLPNSTIISLVECYLAAEGFSPLCIDAINCEIQSRLGDELFSIEELLSIVHVLSSGRNTGIKHAPFVTGTKYSSVSVVSENSARLLSNKDDDELQIKTEQFDKYSSKINPQIKEEIRLKCLEVLDNVWIHLTSRYQDVNQHTLPLVLQALTTDNRNMISLLKKPLAKCWTFLLAEDVATSLDSLVRLNFYSSDIMTYLARWAYVNIHQMTPQLLLSFLITFIHFNFFDNNLVMVMERCLNLKKLLVQTDLIAMCIEYCRSCRYLSPLVMDVAAKHFTQYAYSYEPLQLFVVLRSFGQLNYLPANSSAFLKKVESCLWDRFDHLQEVHLLEILGSFTFIDILPKNFYSRLTSEEFSDRVQNLPNLPKFNSMAWLKLLKHAVILDNKHGPDKTMSWLQEKSTRYYIHLYRDRHMLAVQLIMSSLDQFLGENYYHILPFYGCCAIYLNSMGFPLKITKDAIGRTQIDGQVARKLVILLRTAEQFVVNTKQLIGVQAQLLRQLTELGYVPVEIRANHFVHMNRQTYNGGCAMIKSYLRHYINHEYINSKDVESEGQQYSFNKDNNFLNNLGYDNDVSSGDEDDVLSKNKKNKGVLVEDSGLLTSSLKNDEAKDDGPD